MTINAHDNFSIEELLAPARATASANGSAVDIKDYVGKVKVVLATSAGGGTTPTLDVKLQESADGSSGWTDISGAAFTQVTDAADATEAIGLNVDGVERYIRAVETLGGTSPTFDRSLTLFGRKQTV